MRSVNWTVFILVALLWTAGAYVAAEMARWTADALASGRAAQVAVEIAELPVPEWARFWMNPDLIAALQSALRWAMDIAGRLSPYAGTAAGWLVPLVWTGWGIGMLLLTLGALAIHMLLGRTTRPLHPA